MLGRQPLGDERSGVEIDRLVGAGNMVVGRAHLQMCGLLAEAVHRRNWRLVRIERLRRNLRNAGIDGEDDHRRQPRSAKECRYGSGRRSGILLSVECVGDHAAADAAAGVEAVEHVSGLGLQGEEVIVEVAGEEYPAGGRGDAGDERRGRGVFPALLAGRGIERGQPAFRLFARIGGYRAAVIVHALHDRRVLGRLAENAAPIDRRHEQVLLPGS